MTGDCLVVFNSANATGRLSSLRARKQHACRQFRPPVSRLYSLGELILALWRLKPEEDSSRTLPHPLARHRALVGKTGLPCGSGALLDRVQSTVVPSDRGKFALTQTLHSASGSSSSRLHPRSVNLTATVAVPGPPAAGINHAV
jgi:hypothetical protein